MPAISTEQTLVNGLPLAACIFIGPQLIIKAVNEQMLAIWKKDTSVIGKSLYDAIPELRNQTVFEEQMAAVYQTGRSFNDPHGQAELLLNGRLQTAYFNYSFNPLYDAAGHIYGIMNTAQDTTVQVLERRRRQSAEERLQFALDAAEIGTWDLDIEKQLVKWDGRCQQLHGFSASETVAYSTALRHVHPHDRQRVKEAVQKALDPTFGGHYDERFRTTVAGQNTERWVHSKGKAYFTAKGAPHRFSGTVQDITAETVQARKLRQVQAEFDGAFANAAVGVVITGTDGKVIQCNQAYLNITGYSLAQLNDRSYQDITHPDDLPANAVLIQQLGQGEIAFFDIVKRYIRQNGTTIWVRMNVSSIKDTYGKPYRFIGVTQDITAEKEALQQVEQTLEQLRVLNNEQATTNEQLRLAIASANLGTWFLDATTREFIPSARLKELFGYRPHEEMPYEAAVNQVTDEHRGRVVEAVEAAIAKGEVYNLEYPVVGFHDKKLRWIKATGKLYSGVRGQGDFFAGIIQDISEQKQDEQRKNDFISMVSHELKTPLTSMGGYVQILQAKARKNGDAPAAAMLDKANKQVKKMTTMINGFLNVARLESGKIHIDKSRFDMAVLIKEIKEEARATFTNHPLVFHPVEETFVLADRDKIGQVVYNFISNAAKYSPAGTTIQVACTTRNAEAHISVQDQGMGIAPQEKQKLFDRFYRVPTPQLSTIAGFGIGLYLCKEIIDHHGGQIQVDSEPGKGSTFWFTLSVEKK